MSVTDITRLNAAAMAVARCANIKGGATSTDYIVEYQNFIR